MSTPLLQLNHYFGIRQQPLHRVLIYAPTLIWVQQGHKQLWWQERRLSFDKGSWLLIPAGHQLTFVNQPEQGKFSSHALTLLAPPPAEWLTEAPTTPQREPRLEISPALAFCFELVCSMTSRTLSEATQIQLLHAFYAELHAAHALDLLFPASTMTLGERLARYLGVEPGADHRRFPGRLPRVVQGPDRLCAQGDDQRSRSLQQEDQDRGRRFHLRPFHPDGTAPGRRHGLEG